MGLFNKNKDIKKDDKAGAPVVLSTEEKSVKNKGMKELYQNTKDEKKKEPGVKKDLNKKNGNAYKILLKPLITEKASVLAGENKYFFEVSGNTNKIEIKKAVKEVYGVEPIDINVMSVGGKKVRQGRVAGKRKDWKKAIVTLKKGESIKIYEGV